MYAHAHNFTRHTHTHIYYGLNIISEFMQQKSVYEPRMYQGDIIEL